MSPDILGVPMNRARMTRLRKKRVTVMQEVNSLIRERDQ